MSYYTYTWDDIFGYNVNNYPVRRIYKDYLEVELPGYKKENIEITLDGNKLFIKGKCDRNGAERKCDLCYELDKKVVDVKSYLVDGILTVNFIKDEKPIKRIMIE